MKQILLGSLLLWMCWLAIPLCARTGKAQEETFRLVHADKMFLSRQLEEQILELAGKVHFFYGKTEFHSDRAIIFDKQKIARMYGNVKVSTDTLTLVADTVAYYRIPEILNLGGRVQATEAKPDGSFRTFNAEYGTYDKKEDKLTVWKNVKSYDKQENARGECGYAFWDRKAGYAYLIENPILYTAKDDTLVIRSEKMEFFDLDRRLVATFNVNTKSKDYEISSDFLIYFLKEDRAVFTGQPVFTSEYARATAREFYLWMEDRKPTRAELRDSCVVYFTEEAGAEKENWVKASNIELEFRDNNIGRFSAEERVSYYYKQEKQEKRDYMENSASGEYLEAKFNEDNKLEIMWMNKGIRGKYKFQNNS
ncbi:MAG: OstA-like protein [Candidatus Cloacimonadaceae bacterium]|nr:OstA-like protein [Candidatus Cloacimonadaceae bacterium]